MKSRMPASFSQYGEELSRNGFSMLKGVFNEDVASSIAGRLSAALDHGKVSSTLKSRGQTYGSRNLLETFPEVTTLFNCSLLTEFAGAVLGKDGGVVRALYFNKPPGRSWSLPWHKDRTIAVQRNDQPSRYFRKPTLKAGVPHVEAPVWLLKRMLTLRVHLDAMNGENGPLFVIPGSHLADDCEPAEPFEVHANTGDVLAMRPLLSHSSIESRATTSAHRRVVHIELAENISLPDGYNWYSFVPLTAPRKPGRDFRNFSGS